jgi:diguanylate cyclase (GGDEF)-like protein
MFIVLFAILGMPIMALVNGLSVAAYWFSIFVLGMETLETHDDRLIGWIVYTELIGHNVLATYFLGTQAGFQYYIYVVAFIPFFIFSYARSVYGARLGMVLLIAMVIEISDWFHQARVEVDPEWIAWIHHVNLGIFLAVVSLISYLYAVYAKAHHDQLQEDVYRDHLTGLYNRRFMQEKIQKRLGDASAKPIAALLLIDIDRFKELNDTYGHDCGDNALVRLAKVLAENVCSGTIARWGGEEFLICLPEADEHSMHRTGEQIQRAIETHAIACDKATVRLTVTIGATMGRTSDTFEAMLKRADEALYEGKKTGRNRMVIH